MRIHPRRIPVFVLSVAGCFCLLGLLMGVVVFQLPRLHGQEPFPKPPEQQYVGARKCAPCHLEQYQNWKKDKHAGAFEELKGDHQTDSKCLKCHSTGHGAPSGYGGPQMAETAVLQGVTCEACHGAGSKHVEISKDFTGQDLTDQQQAYINSSIHKMLPGNVCVDCHLQKAHMEHPEVD